MIPAIRSILLIHRSNINRYRLTFCSLCNQRTVITSDDSAYRTYTTNQITYHGVFPRDTVLYSTFLLIIAGDSSDCDLICHLNSSLYRTRVLTVLHHSIVSSDDTSCHSFITGCHTIVDTALQRTLILSCNTACIGTCHITSNGSMILTISNRNARSNRSCDTSYITLLTADNSYRTKVDTILDSCSIMGTNNSTYFIISDDRSVISKIADYFFSIHNIITAIAGYRTLITTDKSSDILKSRYGCVFRQGYQFHLTLIQTYDTTNVISKTSHFTRGSYGTALRIANINNTSNALCPCSISGDDSVFIIGTYQTSSIVTALYGRKTADGTAYHIVTVKSYQTSNALVSTDADFTALSATVILWLTHRTELDIALIDLTDST